MSLLAQLAGVIDHRITRDCHSVASKGFRLFWRFKSRKDGFGRPPISPEIRDLILRKAAANPLWGAPRIHGKLINWGIKICERTVSNLMPSRHSTTPIQIWRTFLKNHMKNMVSIDLFTVPTATFRIFHILHVVSSDAVAEDRGLKILRS